MTEFNLNPNLDTQFRECIKNQGDFLYDLNLTILLLTSEIIAPNPLFSIDMQGHKVLPVFTTEEDWKIFMNSLSNPPENITWNAVSLNIFWQAFLPTEMDTIAFNLKVTEQTASDNLFYFNKERLNEFLDNNSKMINAVVNEENAKAPKLEKNYYIPLILGVYPNTEDIYRAFTVLQAQDGKEYVPIFDTLDSFALWYNNPMLTTSFKENRGQVHALKISQLLDPQYGKNEFGNAAGFVINPMEVDMNNPSDSIILWTDINS
ncbi:MAG: SseB family protein [Lactovum sp.]